MHTIILQADTTNFGPFSSLTDFGLAGIVILALGLLSYIFIKNMMTKQDKLESFVMNELKEMNEKMLTVVQNNTDALMDIKDEQVELKDSINRLNIKIDYLEKK